MYDNNRRFLTGFYLTSLNLSWSAKGQQNPHVDKKQEDFLGNEAPLRGVVCEIRDVAA